MERLADPRQAIGPTANLCGWRSETHLMHFFRARTGMTMREWRARHLASQPEPVRRGP
jgi:AraC-like DNA-binding protein